MLILEDQEFLFDPQNPYQGIEDRQIYTEEGMPISEWEVPLPDLEHFLAK